MEEGYPAWCLEIARRVADMFYDVMSQSKKIKLKREEAKEAEERMVEAIALLVRRVFNEKCEGSDDSPPSWSIRAGEAYVEHIGHVWAAVKGHLPPSQEGDEETKELERDTALAFAKEVYTIFKMSDRTDVEKRDLEIELERKDGEIAIMEERISTLKENRDSLAGICRRLSKECEDLKIAQFDGKKKGSSDG